MLESTYLECSQCHQVIPFDLELVNIAKPAPCCGQSGEARTMWPSHGVEDFLEVALDQNLEDPSGLQVAIVFTATAVEVLLERALWNLILKVHQPSGDLAGELLDQVQGKERRLKLYRKLSDRSIPDLLEQNNLSDFLKDWSDLARYRNEVVHGGYHVGIAGYEAETVTAVINKCQHAFALIHNDIERQARSPKR